MQLLRFRRVSPPENGGSPARASFVRRIWVVLVAALCGLAGIASWALITGHLDATGGRALASTFSAAVCAVTGLVGATVLERARALRRSPGLLTILLSAVVLVLALIFIWTTPEDVTLPHILGASSALLTASVHACLMLGRVRADDARVVRWLSGASVALSTACGFLIAGALLLVTDAPLAGSWRLLGVLAVLGVLCTLLAPIARRLSGHRGDRAPDGGDAVNPSGRAGTPRPCSTSYASRTCC